MDEKNVMMKMNSLLMDVVLTVKRKRDSIVQKQTLLFAKLFVKMESKLVGNNVMTETTIMMTAAQLNV